MQSFDTIFQKELVKLLAASIEDGRDHLENSRFQNIGEMNFTSGKIKAFRDVLNDLIPAAAAASKQENR